MLKSIIFSLLFLSFVHANGHAQPPIFRKDQTSGALQWRDYNQSTWYPVGQVLSVNGETGLLSNYVKTTGSYSNPSWITNLDPTRISETSQKQFASATEKALWNSHRTDAQVRAAISDSVRRTTFVGTGVSVNTVGNSTTVVITGTGSGTVALDNTPALGSNNAVKSNGVALAINQIYAAIDTAHSHLDETSFTGDGTIGNPFKAKAGRGFNPRGAWAATTTYAIDDLLTYNGQTYRVVTAFTSTGSFDATNLELWAGKGQDGIALNADYYLYPSLILESESIPTSTANVTLVNNSVYYRKIVAPKSGTISSVQFRVSTAASSLTAGVGNNSVAILDAAGNILATADCNTAFASTGDKNVSLSTTVSITQGVTYYAAVISTAGTPVSLACAAGTNLINMGQTAAPYNFGRVPTGGMVSPINISSVSVSDARGSGRPFIAFF